jgi:hypothetical protein
MELKIQNLDLEIKRIEGRPPSELRKKFLNLKVRYNKMKEAIEEGDLSLKDYIVIIEKQIQKDKRLGLYFKQINNLKNYDIINERLKVLAKELKEANNHSKK